MTIKPPWSVVVIGVFLLGVGTAIAAAFVGLALLIRAVPAPVAAEAERAIPASPAFHGFAPAPPHICKCGDCACDDCACGPLAKADPAPIVTPVPFPVPGPAPAPVVRVVEKEVRVEVPPPGLIAERDILKRRAESAEAKLAEAADLGRAQLVAEQARSRAIQADLERQIGTLKGRIAELVGSAPGAAPPTYAAPVYYRPLSYRAPAVPYCPPGATS